MTLTPAIVARMTALKSLLDAGDIDLAQVAATRLVNLRQDEPSIAEILDLLEASRFAEAAIRIGKELSEGARLTVWADPEITMLEKELEHVRRELAETEAEQAELAHQLARFEAAQTEALGDRLQRLLELRVELKRLRVLATFESARAQATADYEKAQQDRDEFSESHEEQKVRAAKTDWKLNDAEQRELKRLFREASKRCHPDVVAEEQRTAAANLFRELHEAYENGNLVQVRTIAEKTRLGLFDETEGPRQSKGPEAKERLRNRIQSARQALATTRESLEVLRASTACQTMEATQNWSAYFENQAARIDLEIERIAKEVTGLKSGTTERF
jgi:hypothetical protein